MKMKKTFFALILMAFALAVAAPVFAEDSPQAKTETKDALRKELIQLKYLKAGNDLYGFIYTYLSRNGKAIGAPGNKAVVVSDYPENVAKVLEVIRQIDVKPAELIITVQLVLGSDTEDRGADPVAGDPVIKELRNLLKYKSYSLLDTSMVRAMDNSWATVRMGDKADFKISFSPKVIKDERVTLIEMGVMLLHVRSDVTPPPNQPEANETTLISTALNIKSGDKTVVGVSKLDGGGKGLILIISAKIVD